MKIQWLCSKPDGEDAENAWTLKAFFVKRD